MALKDVSVFATGDWPRTLWPMRLEKVLFQHFFKLVDEACERSGVYSVDGEPSGLRPCITVFSAKNGYHCRRSPKPDPMIAWFLYRWAYSNRAKFRKPHDRRRTSFGYRFYEGHPIPVDVAIQRFRSCAYYCRVNSDRKYLKCDISHFFNSLYHHDIPKQLQLGGLELSEVNVLARALRWISAGRSVDCLPQGLYPTKMIGSYVLVPIDNDTRITSAQLFRVMDDYILRDESAARLEDDFHQIQMLFGNLGLGVNEGKTRMPDAAGADDEDDISGGEMTLGERATVGVVSGEKIELGLRFSRREAATSSDLPAIVRSVLRYPDLIKRFALWCRMVPDAQELARVLAAEIALAKREMGRTLTDYQLFWLAHIADERLADASTMGDIITFILDSTSSVIVRARALEIPIQKFNLPARREHYMKSGSCWEQWCAGIGMLKSPTASRNQLAKYIKNDGEMGRLMAEVVNNLDPDQHDVDWASDFYSRRPERPHVDEV